MVAQNPLLFSERRDFALWGSGRIHLCHRLTGERLKSIGKHFGISESAVSHASKRAKGRIDHDGKLKKKIQLIEKKLKNASFKA